MDFCSLAYAIPYGKKANVLCVPVKKVQVHRCIERSLDLTKITYPCISMDAHYFRCEA